MLKKTLIAAGTAGLIATGAMVGTTGTASAAGIAFGGPGWQVGIGTGPGPGWGWNARRPHQVCRPVFKTVRWWDRWHQPHFKRVVVRQTCTWTYGPGYNPHPGPWQGPNPGWGYPHPY